MRMRTILGLVLGLTLLSACEPKAPAHYLVVCDDYSDTRGSWQLVYADKRDGYILGCAWRNVDSGEIWSRTCTSEGC